MAGTTLTRFGAASWFRALDIACRIGTGTPSIGAKANFAAAPFTGAATDAPVPVPGGGSNRDEVWQPAASRIAQNRTARPGRIRRTPNMT